MLPVEAGKTRDHALLAGWNNGHRMFVMLQLLVLGGLLAHALFGTSMDSSSPAMDGETSLVESIPSVTRMMQPMSNRSVEEQCALANDSSNDQEWLKECSNILELRAKAEALWKSQQGYLWMQHSRKAGGTTLCMTLRLNIYGLVQLHAADHVTPEQRITCQMVKFCSDCDIKAKDWYTVAALPTRVKQAMQRNGRNFIEMEGAGVPVDMITSSAWHDFIFLSTLRHPIDRIVSLLFHARPCQRDKACFEDKKRNFARDANKCDQSGVYLCHSNYYVRMFSGLDDQYTNDADMLQRAKRNFLRFSCVILVEDWDRTLTCLSNRVGLHLRDNVVFNIAGSMNNNDLKPAAPRNTSLQQHLTPKELELFVSYNQVDLEFYEWAKNYILASLDR